jgi:hypothetical protein
MKAKKLVTILALAALLGACNQPFDPRTPLEEKMVVYSIFSTDRDVQFVQVGTNYMPAGFDPNLYTSDNSLRDAFVSMKEGETVILLRDTVLERPDTSRYKFPLRLFTVNPLIPVNGKTYSLLVQSKSLGVAMATVTIPTKPLILIPASTWYLLQNPIEGAQDASIDFTVDLSPLCKGHVAHLFVYYDVLKGGEWTEERMEVPVWTYDDPDAYTLTLPVYPQLTATPLSYKIAPQFTNGYLQNIIKLLTTEKYVNTHLIYKWIVLVVVQAEDNLFKYYQTVQRYRDPLSIRLDEPLYSAIDRAIGMVGAYTTDSLIYVLPPNFAGNR